MKQIDLFPQIVCSFDYGTHFSEEEKQFIASFGNDVSIQPAGNHLSNDKNVLMHPQMTDIKKFVDNSLDEYVKHIIQPKNNLELYVTESWLSFTNKNEKHHGHYHFNSLISGVFYINTVENDKITFVDDRKKLFFFEGYENKYNFSSFNMNVNTGQLILFPSDLEHETQKHEEDRTRISLAFNTFVRGTISNQATWCLKI